MSGEREEFRVGDKVEKDGKYYCEICHTEGGVDEHEFHEGEEFPACMNCGHATKWKKTEE